MPDIIGQNWEESERGWGVRPDGYSLHLTVEDCVHFREEFWKQQRALGGAGVPDEYSRERGEPARVRVDDRTKDLLEATNSDGIWGDGASMRVGEHGVREGHVSVNQFLELHPLLIRARESAEQDFSEITRKVPKEGVIAGVPYSDHLREVARILAEHGALVEVVAAGYLHDHLEDLPELWNKDRMLAEFGSEVTELVDWVTQQDKSLPWEERNEMYNERLRQAPAEALMISAADKISNIKSLIPFMEQGYRVEDVLKRDWAVNSAKFHELKAIFRDKIPEQLFETYVETLKCFDELGSSVG